MTRFEAIIQSLSRVCDKIARGAVVAMMLIVVANISLRPIWRPIYGTYDVVMLLCSVVVAFALGHCAIQGGHVFVELFVQRLPPRAQAIINSITGILGFSLFAMIAWQCWVYGTDIWRSGEVSMSVRIPLYPFMYGVGFGCAVLSLVVLVDLIKSLTKVVGK
jgi:TRAP-type C4-dicarboxylate transport system permease small subunit